MKPQKHNIKTQVSFTQNWYLSSIIHFINKECTLHSEELTMFTIRFYRTGRWEVDFYLKVNNTARAINAIGAMELDLFAFVKPCITLRLTVFEINALLGFRRKLSAQQVAGELEMNLNTFNKYLQPLYRKLKVSGYKEALAKITSLP